MPVLPLVASTSRSPGPTAPRSTAPLIIARAARSLTLPPGLFPSSLASSLTVGDGVRRLNSTRGVPPTVSSTLTASQLPPRSLLLGSRQVGVGAEALDGRTRCRRLGLDGSLVGQLAEGRHGVREPDVAADDAVVADDGVATEDRRAGVDDHAVLYRRVPFALRVDLLHAQAAQRDALVELDVVAQDRGLTYHDPGAVVDAEAPADRGRGVDVAAGDPVGSSRSA